MTREEAQKIIEALVTLRESASDADALNAVAIYPEWREGVTYTTGQRVRFNETLYKVLQDHTSQADWTPEAAHSLFAKVLIPDPETIPEWQQPDSTNPYANGDKVTHNGKTWVSDIDGNVWEPGVVGTESLWEQVI